MKKKKTAVIGVLLLRASIAEAEVGVDVFTEKECAKGGALPRDADAHEDFKAELIEEEARVGAEAFADIEAVAGKHVIHPAVGDPKD